MSQNQFIGKEELEKLFPKKRYSAATCILIILVLAVASWYATWGLIYAAMGGY